jgi:hypothetical protein
MSLLRRPENAASWLFFGTSLFLISMLFCSGPSWAQDARPPLNSISVAHGTTNALVTDGEVLVPISIRHSSDVDILQIGLDYDELMMRFDKVEFRNSIGTGLSTEHHQEGDGYLYLEILFDRLKGIDDEADLVFLRFALLDLSDYGYRADASIEIDRDATRFRRVQDRNPVLPIQMLDGNVAIYLRDAIEIGSANVSLNPQTIRLPVYVTHLYEETNPFTIGLDYDELFLEMTSVIPISGYVRTVSVDWGLQQVTFSSLNGFPRLLRHHICDLEFLFFYDPTQVLEEKILEIVPTPIADATSQMGGGGAVEIRGGALNILEPQFLRGDSDGTGSLDINDALTTLTYLTRNTLRGAGLIPCLDAADTDGNGNIDLSDAVQVLGFLFLGTQPPALPFPEVGPNITDGPSLGCIEGLTTFEPLPLSDSF